jgi:hypothetical protein
MDSKLHLNAVRRHSNSFRVVMNIPMRIGLKTATLVDISHIGILATHPGMLKTESTVEISFLHGDQKFQSSVFVASCTVVGIGVAAGGATLYASRLHFAELTETARRLLDSMIGPV